MKTTYTAEQISDAIENSLLTSCEKYSGRGMYGKECPSAHFEEMQDAFELFADIASEDAELARWMARKARTDSMGRGVVVYWPGAVYDEAKAA